jgi:hypothetical protein
MINVERVDDMKVVVYQNWLCLILADAASFQRFIFQLPLQATVS